VKELVDRDDPAVDDAIVEAIEGTEDGLVEIGVDVCEAKTQVLVELRKRVLEEADHRDHSVDDAKRTGGEPKLPLEPVGAVVAAEVTPAEIWVVLGRVRLRQSLEAVGGKHALLEPKVFQREREEDRHAAASDPRLDHIAVEVSAALLDQLTIEPLPAGIRWCHCPRGDRLHELAAAPGKGPSAQQVERKLVPRGVRHTVLRSTFLRPCHAPGTRLGL
jgi:hypothetical protein